MNTATPLLFVATLLTSSQSRAPESEDAASLLAAQRAGLGEPAAISRLGTVRSRGKVVFEGFPAEGTFTELLAPTGAARLEAIFEGTPRSQRCTNGELYWMTGTGGVEIKRGWSAAADVRLFALGRHRDWRDVYTTAELVGEAQIEGRTCYELRLVPKSPEELKLELVPGEEAPAPDTWWLDRGTKDLVRVAIYATVSGAGWQRLVLDYADWKPVDGVRFPYRSRMSFGPAEHPLSIVFTRESIDTHAKFESDSCQPDEQVFVEFAKLRAGEAQKDPAFGLQTRKSVRTATVRVKCKPSDVQQQLAIILPEVMGYLKRERLTPVGPPFARYHAFGSEIDLEAGIPVAEEVAGNNRVHASSLPGGEIASGMHVGPYQDLRRTHEALARWLAKERRSADGGPWEVYWTDPGLERDPAKWRTEILQPVAPPGSGGGSARAAIAAKSGAAESEDPASDSQLARLNILVGTWKVEGGISGQVAFEWLEGGHFLVQRADLTHGDMRIQGIEIIGHERKFGEASASVDLKSRFYDNLGNTLDYTWEIEGDTLTIWGGERGSLVAYHGTFSKDGNTLTGGWKWPGGGYESTSTRVLAPASAATRDARASK